jgi:hypothetical protein
MSTKAFTDLPDGAQAAISRRMSSVDAVHLSRTNKSIHSVVNPELQQHHFAAFKKKLANFTNAVGGIFDVLENIASHKVAFTINLAFTFLIGKNEMYVHMFSDKKSVAAESHVSCMVIKPKMREKKEEIVSLSQTSMPALKSILCTLFEDVLTEPLLEKIRINHMQCMVTLRNHNERTFSQETKTLPDKSLAIDTRVDGEELDVEASTLKKVVEKTARLMQGYPPSAHPLHSKVLAILPDLYDRIDTIMAFDTKKRGGALKILKRSVSKRETGSLISRS